LQVKARFDEGRRISAGGGVCAVVYYIEGDVTRGQSLGEGPPPLMAGGPTYVICKSGGRSMKASEFFRQMGIEAVNVAGGTMAWMESGRPVESGAVQPGTGRSENMESGRE